MMSKSTFILLLSLVSVSLSARRYEVISPDGRLSLSVVCSSQTTWTMTVDGVTVTGGNRLAMETVSAEGKVNVLGDNINVVRAVPGQVRSEITTPLYRQKSVRNDYNSLTLKCRGKFDLELRAYDEGVAYRFITHSPDSITVRNEVFQFHTDKASSSVIAYQRGKPKADIYQSTFENEYEYLSSAAAPREDKFAFLPMLATTPNGRLLLMESDILDYPGMYIRTKRNVWEGVFPPVPATVTYSRHYSWRRTAYSDFIARTSGERSFPWRIIGYAREDKDLPVNNLSWLLATPSRLDDFSWAEHGLSAWDWWSRFKLTGVDFVSGINTRTYLYHVDFAARFGLKYIILDDGWYKAPDIFSPVPEVDIRQICSYAAAKGIKVILWCAGALADMVGADRLCDHYSALGVSGFKMDFFDGQDQMTVRQICRLAEATAAHRMILDLHGMYKPAGLNRTYPNVLGCEGVFGEENLTAKNINLPLYDVTFPYLRQVSGPTDYTPGAMRNAAKKERTLVARGGASQGTRAHQIALYVVLDQPLGILCDSPSRYEKEEETTRYIASIPTVFDRTFIQSGKVGESIVSVREKDGKWYVGGLTNWDARDAEVSLSFLKEGNWTAEIYRDGVNAHRFGEDYVLCKEQVSAETVLRLHMAPAGGFAIILRRQQ